MCKASELLNEWKIFDDPELCLELIIELVKGIDRKYKENNIEYDTCQREVQDLLHAAEFLNYNAYQGFQITDQIKKVRIKRRKVVNNNELIDLMLPHIRRYKCDLQALGTILEKIRSLKEIQEDRKYTCRVREDLQNSFDRKKLAI